MQPERQTGEHLARECGIIREFAEYRGPADVQQHAVGQSVRRDDIRSFEKHQRLAETLPGADDLHNLLAALRGREAQLDLSVDDDVKARTGITRVEHCLALFRMHGVGAVGDAIEFRIIHFTEH